MDRDIVRCHCATPRRIVAALTDETWHDDLAEHYAEPPVNTAGRPVCYDDQFTLQDRSGRAMPDTYYTFRYASGQLVLGVTDSVGRTVRHRTHCAQAVALYVGNSDALMSGIYHAIVESDPLDNGGNSHAIGAAPHATIEGPDHRSRGQTHLGHQARCSVCQSFGPILAGASIRESLRG
jgi:hypothetical protein